MTANRGQMSFFSEDEPGKPFLRWAGGKSWFIKEFKRIAPSKFGTYHEPFLGSGAVFFSLSKSAAYLSDINQNLINTYRCVRDNPQLILDILGNYKNTEVYYYKIRQRKYKDPYEQAAQFIYLNRTSFNGIYRENSDGLYNVPYGFRNIELVNEEAILNASARLKGVGLDSCDFRDSLKRVKAGDLIFIDPPYAIPSKDKKFIQYNKKTFSLADQIDLANLLEVLNGENVYFIMTNAYNPWIRECYRKVGQFKVLSKANTIGGAGASRQQTKEYLITNLRLEQ